MVVQKTVVAGCFLPAAVRNIFYSITCGGYAYWFCKSYWRYRQPEPIYWFLRTGHLISYCRQNGKSHPVPCPNIIPGYINEQRQGWFPSFKTACQAQRTMANAFAAAGFNHDDRTDILTAGNFYGTIPYEGRYDAGLPMLLLQQNSLKFEAVGPVQSSLEITGQIRCIRPIHLSQRGMAWLLSRNNGRIAVVQSARWYPPVFNGWQFCVRNTQKNCLLKQ